MARGTVYERPEKPTPWIAQIDAGPDPGTGRRRRRTKAFATKKDAERWINAAAAAIDGGGDAEPGTVTVGQYLDQWCASLDLAVTLGDLRPNTASWYRGAVATHIVPRVGALRLAALDPAAIEALYGDLAREVSAVTLRRVHVTLRRALAAAVRHGLLPRNPVDQISHRPRVTTGRGAKATYWTAEEVATFLEAVASDRLVAAFRFLAVTGCRRGEALRLSWSDVDLDAAEVTIRAAWVMQGGSPVLAPTKTGRVRRIMLDPGTVAALRVWRRRQREERLAWGEGWQDSGRVFTREDGGPVRPDWFTRRFGRLTDAAGLPRLTPHGLRHSAATYLVANGVPLPTVAEILGHSSIRVTGDTYAHVMPATHRAAVDALGAAVNPG